MKLELLVTREEILEFCSPDLAERIDGEDEEFSIQDQLELDLAAKQAGFNKIPTGSIEAIQENWDLICLVTNELTPPKVEVQAALPTRTQRFKDFFKQLLKPSQPLQSPTSTENRVGIS